MYDYLRNQMYDEIYTLIEDDGLTTLLRSIWLFLFYAIMLSPLFLERIPY